MPSSPAKGPRKSARVRRVPWWAHRRTFPALWPLVICVILDPFLIRLAGILALAGPRPFTLLYPWVEFLHLPVLHLTAELMSTLSQWLLYLQFPLYGLLMTLTSRADKRLRAINIGIAVHFGGVLLVVLLAFLQT